MSGLSNGTITVFSGLLTPETGRSKYARLLTFSQTVGNRRNIVRKHHITTTFASYEWSGATNNITACSKSPNRRPEIKYNLRSCQPICFTTANLRSKVAFFSTTSGRSCALRRKCEQPSSGLHIIAVISCYNRRILHGNVSFAADRRTD